MKVIVMGCGRIGSQTSELMSVQGHDVVVIDHDANAMGRLGPRFKGRVVQGLGFDRDVLIKAGIEQADAFVASSSSDNANIVAARIARNIFHVPRVVARLYDPLRAEVYQRLGLITISSTTWGAERIYQVLTHTDLDVIHTFGRGEVSLVALEVPTTLVGKTVAQLSVPGEIAVVSITRSSEAFMPRLGTEFQDGDMIVLSVLTTSMSRLEEMLGLERR
ncbi:MAG TPA: TrkA family potassium uptake protein [Anaerolineales bacterium]